MLTHKNLTSMASKLSSLFTLYTHDKLLSVLPLHHTFEFSAGFLMPLVHGASIDYLEEVDADTLAHALEDEGVTGMVGVPALWQLLERKIYKNVGEAGVLVERAFDAVIDLNRQLRDKLPWSVGAGKLLFYPVHKKLGGRMRLLISGGSALPADTMKSFRGLGFNLYEGYGMTESAPVLTVTRPGDKLDRRQRRSAAAGHRRAHRSAGCERRRRDDREGPQRHGRLLRERRGHGADARQTAGCTPATSAASTPKATCSSSAARRR